MVRLYRFYCCDCDFAWVELSSLEFPTSKCEFCKRDFTAEEVCDNSKP